MSATSVWYRSPKLIRIVDATLIACAFAIGIAGHVAARTNASVEAAPLSVVFVVVSALAAGVLWIRRSRPLQSLGLLLAIAIIASAIHDPGLYSVQVGLEAMVLFHAAGSWCSRLRLATSVSLGSMGLIAIAATGDSASVLSACAFATALVAFPFAAGYAARVRRQYLEQIEQRLVDAEREREDRERAAIARERSRIARELHDVVAHHVSLIGVQAGAARTTRGASKEATDAALLAIEASSRTAVGEMHRLLSILEPTVEHDDRNQLQPQPGLHEMPALIERLRTAGVDVTVESNFATDNVGALSAALSLTCYRILEESLTNVVKHSLAKRVVIQLTLLDDSVAVGIHDPGPPDSASIHPGGRGVRGMRERVEAFGGSLEAVATPGGGFRVSAVIPKDAA